MKVLRNIFTNPLAIASAVFHWLVLFYSLIFEETDFFSRTISFHRYAPVYEWLLYLNYIPLMITETAGNLLNSTIGMDFLLSAKLMIFAFLIVSFQWLLVGYSFSKMFNLFEQDSKTYLKIK